MTQDPPEVAVLVLNWNGLADTVECLSSLKKQSYENLCIYLVDNASSDESVWHIREKYPDIIIIENDRNLGFAGGNNVGIRRALSDGSDYTLLLNNDIIFRQKNAIENLVQTMEINSDIGILSPLILELANDGSVWFERGVINWSTGFVGHIFTTPNNFQLINNDYVPFASVLIRADVFEDVGLLPEEYFLYYEDADYCLAVRDVGYKVMTDRSCKVYHKVSSSAGKTHGPISSYYVARNRWLFARHHPDRINPAFYLHYPYWLMTRLAYRLYLGELSGVVAFFRGAVDAMRNVTGKGPYPSD